jgi:hypothetical protein
MHGLGDLLYGPVGKNYIINDSDGKCSTISAILANSRTG